MTNVVAFPGADSRSASTEAPSTEVPDFITRIDIDKMSDQELDQLTLAIRQRRLHPVAIYQRTVEEKSQVLKEKAREKLNKKCEQIVRLIERCNNASDALEKAINELRGLRIQASLEVL